MSVIKEFIPQPDKAFLELQSKYSELKHDTRMFSPSARIPTVSEKSLAEHYGTTTEIVIDFDNWLKTNNLVKSHGMLEAFLAGYAVAEAKPMTLSAKNAIIYERFGLVYHDLES